MTRTLKNIRTLDGSSSRKKEKRHRTKAQFDRLALTSDEVQYQDDMEHYTEDERQYREALRRTSEARGQLEGLERQAHELQLTYYRKERMMNFEERAKVNQDIRMLKDQSQDLRSEVEKLEHRSSSLEKIVRHPLQHMTQLPPLASQSSLSTTYTRAWFIGKPEKDSKFGQLYYGLYHIGLTPPTQGWLACFPHAVEPVPTIKSIRSSGLETWELSGAGAKGINGRYVELHSSGKHPTKVYESKSGIQLFSDLVQKNQDLDVITANSSEDTPTADDGLNCTPYVRKLLSHTSNFSKLAQAGTLLAREHQQRPKDIKPSLNQTQQQNRNIQIQTQICRTRAEAVPALCHRWVLRHCPKPMSSCPLRHYYISQVESDEKQRWQQSKNAALEMLVLKWIVQRETLLEVVAKEAQESQQRFQQHTRASQYQDVEELLNLCNVLRLMTVRVYEAIQVWRDDAMKCGWMALEHEAENMKQPVTSTFKPACVWAVTMTVDGPLLYGPSKAFAPKIRKFRRPADPYGKKERNIKFIGTFASKVEAEQAYDLAANVQARELNIPVTQIPPRRTIFRTCGLHYAIESEGEGPTQCELCRVKSQLHTFLPSYIWNGQNYILKTSSDCNFLANILPLTSFLGSDFPLENNPFMIPRASSSSRSLDEVFSHTGFSAYEDEMQATVGGQVFQYRGMQSSREPIFDLEIMTPSTHAEPKHERVEFLSMTRIQQAQEMWIQELNVSAITGSKVADVPASDASPSSPIPKVKVEEYRTVEALYWDRCAALTIVQRRKALPASRPEFQLEAYYGKHMKQLQFLEKLKKAGEALTYSRREMISTLRKVTKLPYGVFDPDTGAKLIVQARELKGGVVLLEANVLEKQIAKWYTANASALVIQRSFRGMVGRNYVTWRRRALVRARKNRLVREQAIANVARWTVSQDIVLPAIKQTIRVLRKAVFKSVHHDFAGDHQHVCLTVHSLEHHDFVHFAQRLEPVQSPFAGCVSCSSTHAKSLRYSCASHAFVPDLGPCTCRVSRPLERLMFRAYDPVTSAVFPFIIENHAMISRLQQYLIEHELPPSTLISRACRLETLPMDSVLFPQDHSREHWQPIYEAKRMKQLAQWKWKYAVYVHQQSKHSRHRAKTIQALHRQRVQEHAQALEALESQTQRYHLACQALARATEKSDTALYFSKSQLVKLQQSASEQARHHQSWDPLEGANDVGLLVKKRQALVHRDAMCFEMEKCRQHVFQCEWDIVNMPSRVSRANARALVLDTKALRARQEAQRYAALASTCQTLAHQVCRVLCSTLTLRHAPHLPLRRVLSWNETYWNMPKIIASSRASILVPEVPHGPSRIFLDLARCGYQAIARQVVNISTTRLLVEVYAPIYDPWTFFIRWYDPKTCATQEIICDPEIVQAMVYHIRVFSCKPYVELRTAIPAYPLQRAQAQTLIQRGMERNAFTRQISLRRLTFLRHQRALVYKFQSRCCRWWQDLIGGRLPSGKGREVFRQGLALAQVYCHVIMYERWGTFHVQVYLPHSCQTMPHQVLSFHQVAQALASRPHLLQQYLLSVQSCTYAPSLLQNILQHLQIKVRKNGGQPDFVWHSRVDDAGFPTESRLTPIVRRVYRVNSRKMILSLYYTPLFDRWRVEAVDILNESLATHTLVLSREQLTSFWTTHSHSAPENWPNLFRSGQELQLAQALFRCLVLRQKSTLPSEDHLGEFQILQTSLAQFHHWLRSRTSLCPLTPIPPPVQGLWELQVYRRLVLNGKQELELILSPHVCATADMKLENSLRVQLPSSILTHNQVSKTENQVSKAQNQDSKTHNQVSKFYFLDRYSYQGTWHFGLRPETLSERDTRCEHEARERCAQEELETRCWREFENLRELSDILNEDWKSRRHVQALRQLMHPQTKRKVEEASEQQDILEAFLDEIQYQGPKMSSLTRLSGSRAFQCHLRHWISKVDHNASNERQLCIVRHMLTLVQVQVQHHWTTLRQIKSPAVVFRPLPESTPKVILPKICGTPSRSSWILIPANMSEPIQDLPIMFDIEAERMLLQRLDKIDRPGLTLATSVDGGPLLYTTRSRLSGPNLRAAGLFRSPERIPSSDVVWKCTNFHSRLWNLVRTFESLSKDLASRSPPKDHWTEIRRQWQDSQARIECPLPLERWIHSSAPAPLRAYVHWTAVRPAQRHFLTHLNDVCLHTHVVFSPSSPQLEQDNLQRRIVLVQQYSATLGMKLRVVYDIQHTTLDVTGYHLMQQKTYRFHLSKVELSRLLFPSDPLDQDEWQRCARELVTSHVDLQWRNGIQTLVLLAHPRALGTMESEKENQPNHDNTTPNQQDTIPNQQDTIPIQQDKTPILQDKASILQDTTPSQQDQMRMLRQQAQTQQRLQTQSQLQARRAYLQRQCRLYRLQKYVAPLIHARQHQVRNNSHRTNEQRLVLEGHAMAREDRWSQTLRPLLTFECKMFQKMIEIYRQLAEHATIQAFQAFLFGLNLELDPDVLEEAFEQVSKQPETDFMRFVDLVWWFCHFDSSQFTHLPERPRRQSVSGLLGIDAIP